MNPEHQDFEQLRRLLVLKRYEQPPPGYFDRFSSQVIARIRTAEAERETVLSEAFMADSPWFRRLWAALEGQPVVAGLFGAAVCALLVSGIVHSEDLAPVPIAIGQVVGGDTTASYTPRAPMAMHAAVEQPTSVFSSTNPVAASLSSLFDHAQPRVDLIAYPVRSGH